MCDHFHYEALRKEVDEHDDRLDALEKTDAVHDAKIDALAKQAWFQMITVWAAFFLVLLTLVWIAVGPDGFRDVTSAAKSYKINNMEVNQNGH